MAQSSFFRRPAVMLALALASISIVVTLMGKLAAGPSSLDQKRIQMSGGSGFEAYPSLSSDGKHLAYSARESAKSGVWHVYVRDVPSGAPKQLTRDSASDVGPVWSPDGGTLAFQRIGEEKVEYVTMPADGGPESKVCEFASAGESLANPLPAVSWLPDGKSLIVVQLEKSKPPALASVALSSGKVERLTNPPEGSEGDSTPVVSPGGDSLAFARGTTDEGSDVWVADIKGANPRRVTFDNRTVRGIAWTRDGQDLLYSANRLNGWHIWRIPSGGGSPHEITIAGQSAHDPAVGRNRLAYTDSPTASAIWRSELGGDGTAEERLLIRSNGGETGPAWSPDGSRIASIGEETGGQEIFLQDSNGKNRVQLTHMNRPRIGRVRWSADAKWLIFDAGSGQGSEIYVMGAVPGAQPARVVPNGSEGSFSQDGKSIYFDSRGQIWKAAANGSHAEVFVKMMGAGQPVESADGKYLIFRYRRSLWRVPAQGGEPEEFIVPDQDMFWTSIQPARKGVYYLVWERSARGMAVIFYDYATKKGTVLTHSSGFDRNAAMFSVSPDGKYILYPKVDSSQTNVMVVENFK